jgi:ankyrin repeat protein
MAILYLPFLLSLFIIASSAMDNPHGAKIKDEEQEFCHRFYGVEARADYKKQKSVLSALVKKRITYGISCDSEIYNDGGQANLDPPLFIAVCCDTRISITKKLLRHGANPNLVRPRSKLTPLGMACLNGPNLKTVRALLRAGADPNFVCSINRSTPLHRACLEAYRYYLTNNRSDKIVKLLFKTISLLLRYGADPNIQDRHGNTPLFELVSLPKEGMDFVAQLLLFGADITIKNNTGQDIFEYVQTEQYRPVFNTVVYLKDWQEGKIKFKKKKLR